MEETPPKEKKTRKEPRGKIEARLESLARMYESKKTRAKEDAETEDEEEKDEN